MPVRRLIVMCAALQLCGALAFGDDALLPRAPSGANAVVAADVVQFMKTPMARQQNWDAHDAGRGPQSPSPLPSLPDLQRLLLVSRLNTETADPVWEAAVLEFGKAIPAATIKSRVGGYVDTVGGKTTVRTRADTFFVALDERTVGAAFLADRQFVSRWVARQAGDATGASAYLQNAVAQVGPDSPIVMAIDLEEAVSEASVRRMLERDPPAGISGAAVNPAELAAALASIKGVTVKVAVADGAVGTATIEFAKPAAALATIAKPFILDIVASHGMSVPDLAKWEFAVNGNTVTATGGLSPESLHRLMTVLQAPSAPDDRTGADAAARPASDRGTPPPSGNATQQARVVASQKYFKTISQIMDAIKPGTSLEATASWLARDARRIDQLPIADVDPDLMAWGGQVAAALRQAASICSTGQQSVRASVVAVDNPYGISYSSGTGYDVVRDRDRRASEAEARRQNQQAMSAQKAQISASANEPLQRALDSRAAIRADMVKRYGVNF